jgi:hypothetical protein
MIKQLLLGFQHFLSETKSRLFTHQTRFTVDPDNKDDAVMIGDHVSIMRDNDFSNDF